MSEASISPDISFGRRASLVADSLFILGLIGMKLCENRQGELVKLIQLFIRRKRSRVRHDLLFITPRGIFVPFDPATMKAKNLSAYRVLNK